MDPADQFLHATTHDRLEMARDDANRPALSRLLGDQAFAELRGIADRHFQGSHLAPDAPKNLIFVPGIMGSLLMNSQLAGIWWIDVRTRDCIDRLGLSDDGTKDADGLDNVKPVTADPSYMPFLTAALAEHGYNHDIFPYDWRKSPLQCGAGLRDLVLRQYQDNGGQPVNIVAHSMGGLIVRAALMRHGDELWPKIGKIVFIATPHYGATAIAGYLKNHLWGFETMAVLGAYLSRATLRSLWGVMTLLPAPRGIYPGTRPADPHPWPPVDRDDPYQHPCANFDLYDAVSWKLDLDTAATAKLQHILDASAAFHRDMYRAHCELDQDNRDKMLVIAGVGYKTLFRLAYQPGFLGLWEKTTKIFDRVADDPHRDGDGRVPLASAMLENIKGIRYVYGVHGGLPNIPEVYRDVFSFLRGQPLKLPNTVAGALSGHLAGPVVSAAPALDGSAAATAFSDDPGLWDLQHPSPQRMSELEALLATDKLPEFGRIHLL